MYRFDLSFRGMTEYVIGAALLVALIFAIAA
jgi:hypothetical protein